MTWLETIIIAVVEGLTEFLPVSSTGHMIITQNLLGIPQGDAFVHAFTFIIQFGAILSVVCLYWKKFFKLNNSPAPAGSNAWQKFLHKFRFYWLLFIGVLPAVIIGLLAKKSGLLDWLLDSVEVVAIMLVLGGVFMLFCDQMFNKGNRRIKVNGYHRWRHDTEPFTQKGCRVLFLPCRSNNGRCYIARLARLVQGRGFMGIVTQYRHAHPRVCRGFHSGSACHEMVCGFPYQIWIQGFRYI